ncbi:MAG: hypothetical protein F6K41_41005 [Symploca sp. SIO3E6]|nr:hypothetical protein [Caldora sp. SIO3E6]
MGFTSPSETLRERSTQPTFLSCQSTTFLRSTSCLLPPASCLLLSCTKVRYLQ